MTENNQNSYKIILNKSMGKLIRWLASIRMNYEVSYMWKNNKSGKNQTLFFLRRGTKNLGKLL